MTAILANRSRADPRTPHELVEHMLGRMRPRRMRSLREWVEQEVYLTGAHPGRFKVARQPVAGPILDLLGDPRWNRSILTGPVQRGKSLLGFVLPACYHACELGQWVIIGVPDLDMAGDKWTRDMLPVLEKTRYRDLLPTSGAGSRGASSVRTVALSNGGGFRFMTAGGGDKSRAGYTAQIVCMTEVDGFDRPGGGSPETDKVSQIEARTAAYGPRKRVYMECTVTTPDGRTWSEYQAGTATVMYVACPHCHEPVAPDRQHHRGWEDAENVQAARAAGAIVCPHCAAMWSEQERQDALRGVVPVHRGQSIERDGDALRVIGEPEVTDTLGLRFNAALDALVPLSEVSGASWSALRASDRDAAERKISQYDWALPISIGAVDLRPLDPAELSKAKGAGLPRGRVPSSSRALALGVDVGRHLLHWSLVSLGVEDAPYVVDYGRVEIESTSAPEDRSVSAALQSLMARCREGWPTEGGALVSPAVAWVDEGYLPHVVRATVAADKSGAWFPARGMGWQQRKAGKTQSPYRAPTKRSQSVAVIGVGYHIVRLPAPRGLRAAHVDADAWKSFVHDRLALANDKPGAAIVYRTTSPSDHMPFFRHLTAERRVSEVKPGVGVVTRWENPTGRNNHWLDSTCLAIAAGHYAIAAGAQSGVGAAAKPKGSDWFNDRRRRRSR